MLLRPLLLACALLLPAAAAGILAAPRPAAAFETAARAAIVIDFRTNATLYAKDPDTRIPPASMSKLMTAYMVFERLKEGSLKLDDTLPVSEKFAPVALPRPATEAETVSVLPDTVAVGVPRKCGLAATAVAANARQHAATSSTRVFRMGAPLHRVRTR